MNARPDPQNLKAAAALKPAPQPDYEPYYTRDPDTVAQLTLGALEQHFGYYTPE